MNIYEEIEKVMPILTGYRIDCYKSRQSIYTVAKIYKIDSYGRQHSIHKQNCDNPEEALKIIYEYFKPKTK